MLGRSLKRFTDTEFGKQLTVVLLVGIMITAAVVIWAGDRDGVTHVLIIYSSGTPFKTISDMTAKEVDTVTGATPIRENCKSIAEKLGVELKREKYNVKIVRTDEIKSPNEIMSAHILVLGTPTRFWNVSWEMKRLLDEQFSRIYVVNKKAFEDKKVAAFVMAEYEPSGKDALMALGKAIRDCGGQIGPTMIFLTGHSDREIRKRLENFVNKIKSVF